SPIKNGKFSLSAEQGLIPGQEYLVQFRSVEVIPNTQTETDDPMKMTAESRDIIPPKYGNASKETITATKNSPNVYRFDLVNQ
ncbi:MAG: hypothetical protein LBQ50_04645, partial [Planctomycetaceae bacterium]|nr:hypothetical protein [Planctomycetaceae bacterium]